MSESQQLICPLCNDPVDKLLFRFHIDSETAVIDRLRQAHPGWTENDGVCSRCIDYYHTEIVREQRLLPEIGPYFPVRSVDDFIILPTPIRLDANPHFTGKGVTICFIDSDFFPHPDLTCHYNRIKAMVDITGSGPSDQPEGQWHGTMTSVVCAGDGYLSNGLYKGIAAEANLVLLKVQDNRGRILQSNIIKALEWVLENHSLYGIRVVNMSLGDDEAVSYKESKIDQLAEALIERGITVVAAVGNTEDGQIKPPANGLHVIAIGGIDDDNRLNAGKTAYHSTYGRTSDALMKPELVAQAIWIAAPILPGTAVQKEAALLHDLLQQSNEALIDALESNIAHTMLDSTLRSVTDPDFIRGKIIERIQRGKFIAPHYMHADGTSFAAPIVSAVVAQLIECNPLLSPADIRHILFSSAKRLDSIAPERQGYGMIQPRKAILQALKQHGTENTGQSPYIDNQNQVIEFSIRSSCASQVALTGSFNQWATETHPLQPCKDGWWKISIPLLAPGKYHYKFLIDENNWTEDTANPFREPDGIAGFNSVLLIEN